MKEFKICKYDPWHWCNFEIVPDDEHCLACTFDMAMYSLSRQDLGLVGYQMKILSQILGNLGYVVPRPSERKREQNTNPDVR